ncbi:MAG TPA: type II secretion system protein [Candidatus Udaeobacter sp.]|nr:type II secretion system protein [Candidatus Udaeobacter sp.]
MTNVKRVATARVRHSNFGIRSSFVIRHSSFRARGAFTLIELVVVFGLILVLTGLVLSTVGYARKKGARARAETEIAAMAAACESYKADNAVYPRDPTAGTATDTLNARTMGDPATYQTASLVLYRALSGDRNLDRTVSDTDRNFNIDGTALSPPLGQLPQTYFTFKPNMLSPAGGAGTVTAIADPFGNSYGYSTANQFSTSTGYNPTFDLWSTSGLTANPPGSGTDTITPQWIKNW